MVYLWGCEGAQREWVWVEARIAGDAGSVPDMGLKSFSASLNLTMVPSIVLCAPKRCRSTARTDISVFMLHKGHLYRPSTGMMRNAGGKGEGDGIWWVGK